MNVIRQAVGILLPRCGNKTQECFPRLRRGKHSWVVGAAHISMVFIFAFLALSGCGSFSISPAAAPDVCDGVGDGALEIQMAMPVNLPSGEKDPIPDLSMIEKALNDITIPKINVKVRLTKIMTPHDQNLMIMLSSNR